MNSPIPDIHIVTPDLCLGKVRDEVSLAPALALAAGDDAVGGPLMLDLEHDPLVGLIGDRQRFGDDAVDKMQPWDENPMMLLAQNLFVTDFDLGPLMTLAVGLSGRNSETIKDLTVDHDLLEEKAVRVKLVKRRRGPGGMTETVHWEVGTPSQQLQRPGGFYLLMEQMMRPSRAFSATSSLWSVWNPRQATTGPSTPPCNSRHGTWLAGNAT